MTRVRNLVSAALVVAVAIFIAGRLAVEGRAQTLEKSSLAGLWTLNRQLSDAPPARESRTDGGQHEGRRGGFSRGGARRGLGGGMGGGRMGADPEAIARRRDALRDILAPPDHLTIVQTDSMIVLTGPDGRTTRLAPDGQKIKDDNTDIERRTRWDTGKLVSEITGAAGGRITQSFAVDPAAHQLRITVEMNEGRSNQPHTITHVYDADQR
jgi:hypothetical protein